VVVAQSNMIMWSYWLLACAGSSLQRGAPSCWGMLFFRLWLVFGTNIFTLRCFHSMDEASSSPSKVMVQLRLRKKI